MTRHTVAVGILALLSFPLSASSGAEEAALVTLRIDQDGARVFAPQMLVRFGEMTGAAFESPEGEGHRVVLSVSRDDGEFVMRSMYLTKVANSRWVLMAEPVISVRNDTPASLTLRNEDGELRFNVEISGGESAQLRSQFSTNNAAD